MKKEQAEQIVNEYMKPVYAFVMKRVSSELLAKPVRRQQEFLLQHMFNSDGWLLLYAKDSLVKSGRLKPVEDEKRHVVSEMLIAK